MLAYPFNDIMIKVTTLFTKTKILQYFSEFLNFKTFSCPCPIMRWYCQFFLPTLQFKLGLLEIKGIISYLSLPRLNAIGKKTMEIVWSGFLCGIVLSLMVYLSMCHLSSLFFSKNFFKQCGFLTDYTLIIKETFSGTPCIPPDNFYADLKFVFVMFTFVTSWHWAKLPPLFGVSGIAPEIKIICRQCIFDFDHHGPGSPSGLRQLFPSGPRVEEKLWECGVVDAQA